MSDAVATPGVDRVKVFRVGAHEYGFRRPSRGDLAEIWRRFAAKLIVTGIQTESDVLSQHDGMPLLWEARLEVGLVPRLARLNGTAVALGIGERAPAHWLQEVEGQPARISFDNVDPDEFDAVCEQLEVLFKKKAPVTTPATKAPSGASAPDSTSA